MINLVPPDSATQLPSISVKEMGHATRDDHSGIWHVVYQVIRHSILAALPDHDARRMPIDAAQMMNVVVDGFVPGRGKRFAITGVQADAARARVMNATGVHAVPGPSRNGHAAHARVAGGASSDLNGRAAVDHATALPRRFQVQPDKPVVRYVLEPDDGMVERGHDNLGPVERFRRI